MKTLYLDMDGVLSDFDRAFFELIGEKPKDAYARKVFYDGAWEKFVAARQFALQPKTLS